MKAEQMVGQNLKRAREQRKLTQEDLGRELKGLLGKEWSRQAVSIAEAGGRRFEVAELICISLALRVPIYRLLLPVGSDDEPIEALELPSGETLETEQWVLRLFQSGARTDAGVWAAETFELIAHWHEHFRKSLDVIRRAADSADSIIDDVAKLSRVTGDALRHEAQR